MVSNISINTSSPQINNKFYNSSHVKDVLLQNILKCQSLIQHSLMFCFISIMNEPMALDVTTITPLSEATTESPTPGPSSTVHMKHVKTSTSHDHNYDDVPVSSASNPCPLCGRPNHPVECVNKLPYSLQLCFLVPEVTNSDKPKRRINKLARFLTTENMIKQVQEKEEKINIKKEKNAKRKTDSVKCNPNKKLTLQKSSSNVVDDFHEENQCGTYYN